MAKSTIDLHRDAVTAAAGDKQNAQVPGVSAATMKAADIAYHQALVTSCMTNSISPVASLYALRSLGASPPAEPSVAPHMAPDQLPVEPGKPEPHAGKSKPTHR